MSYYYDLLVNPKERFYEFYEWEKNDNIKSIKKVPLLKVPRQTIYDFLAYECSINDDFYKEIKNKTVIKNNSQKITCVLFTDSKNSIFLEFNDKNEVIGKSKLLIEDENELLEIAKNMKITTINYLKKEKLFLTKETRKTIEEKRKIISELQKIKEEELLDKAKYIYYEWFHEIDDELPNMLLKMEEELQKIEPKKVHQIARLVNLSNKEKL